VGWLTRRAVCVFAPGIWMGGLSLRASVPLRCEYFDVRDDAVSASQGIFRTRPAGPGPTRGRLSSPAPMEILQRLRLEPAPDPVAQIRIGISDSD